MTATHSIAQTLLVAIHCRQDMQSMSERDISKHRHEVLIGIPGKTRRRRLTIMNTLEDFQRLSAVLSSYDLPVRIGFEGQTMGLAATITARWRIISARPGST